MSWPADGAPRFIVGSITGGDAGGSQRAGPEAYVYDRACCHAIVATFSDGNQLWRALDKAQRECDRLNA